jgi:hypothetical protein
MKIKLGKKDLKAVLRVEGEVAWKVLQAGVCIYCILYQHIPRILYAYTDLE